MNRYRNSSEYIEVSDNVFLNILDWGEGKTVVFLPGWPFGHEMFEYQFTQLSHQGYRCIGISMRGFGKSSKPWGDSNYTYDVFADDLKSILQSLDLTNITLVGFSMGGAIALRYMSRHKGERVASLVLCSAAAPSFTIRPGFPFGIEPGAVDDLIKLCYSDRAKLNADFCKLLFKDSSVITPQLLDWFRSLAMEASAHATAACLVTLRDSDLREDLPFVQIPTILFHGVHDQICPFNLAETLTAPTEAMPAVAKAMAGGADAVSGGIYGARLLSFVNSGHALFFEEREKCNAELIKFIEKKNVTEEKFFGAATR